MMRGDKGSSAIKPVTYEYDLLGQLTRVNDPNDATAGSTGTTWVYAYDRGGNIKEKNAYNYTTGTVSGVAASTMSFAYDSSWKDKLYSVNGQVIQSDAIGNTTNDGTWSYTWRAGRQLAGMSKSGTTVSYAYDADGLRTRKTVNGTATEYTLHGKLLTHMKKGNDQLHFYYDEQSRPAMVNYNGTIYTYVHDLQGDIVAIVDRNGNSVVEYWYDAWGKPLKTTGTLTTTLGALNPFRYRGYVFDEETGLYYLKTRYYKPEWGRFLITDTYISTGQGMTCVNRFVYGGNNPVNTVEVDGQWFMFLTAAIGAVVGAVVGGVVAAANGEDVWKGAAIGAAAGGLLGLGGGAVAAHVLAGSATAATGTVWAAATGYGTTAAVGTAAAVQVGAELGTTIGKLGTLVENPKIVVDWSQSIIHGAQRMAERGMTQQMVDYVVANGKALQQGADKFLFITKQGAAVVTRTGYLVTTYSSQFFDAQMIEHIKTLFGG